MTTSTPDNLDVEASAGATQALLAQQRGDGHWVFELEADATIPSEYVLLRHYLGEPDDLELERKIGVYLRRIQGEHGGWPLFHGGAFDISATVKAYFCLKMIGDDPACRRTWCGRARRSWRVAGLRRANVFTRILLAQFGELSWDDVPTIPVELILLPRWFPIHLSRMSYWARTVMVPLLVLAALQACGRAIRAACASRSSSPDRRGCRPSRPAIRSAVWALFFNGLDRVLKVVEPFWPKAPAPARHRALPELRRPSG